MSPYGSSAPPTFAKTLAATIYDNRLAVHHLNRSTCPEELIDLLHEEFSKELGRGLTYPQETTTLEDFKSYFLGYELFVGIATTDAVNGIVDIEHARAGREWKDCVAGAYYVKPNYPGRSSHICNGGFIVRPASRGQRFGILLGQSYLHYAPLLGYRGSVFNLVYANNVASTRIWDQLGFTRAGLIPQAGRLKKIDGSDGEEYIDAIVYYKSFIE